MKNKMNSIEDAAFADLPPTDARASASAQAEFDEIVKKANSGKKAVSAAAADMKRQSRSARPCCAAKAARQNAEHTVDGKEELKKAEATNVVEATKSVEATNVVEATTQPLTAEECFKVSSEHHDDSIDEYISAIDNKIRRECLSGGFSTVIKFRVASDDWVNIGRILDWYRIHGFGIDGFNSGTTAYGTTVDYEFTISWASAGK